MPIKQIYSQAHQTQPLITFVIACYNLDMALLKECLDSILSLSLSPEEREIILVDDGSEQSPVSALDNYIDQLIYLRQHHQGLSVARNTGIGIATGKYIQFVDGDDSLVVTAYEHCLDIIRYDAPDIVYFQSATNKMSVHQDFTKTPSVSGVDYMRQHNLRATAWGYAFKKSLLINLRFTPGILHEDEEFTPILFLRAESVVETSARAYYYRQRSGSITQQADSEWVQKRLSDTEQIICRLDTMAANLPQGEQQALRRRVAQLTMDYLYNVMKLTHDNDHLEIVVARLQEKGLFPLPPNDYSAKYTLFRRMSANRTSRRLLFQMITKIKS